MINMQTFVYLIEDCFKAITSNTKDNKLKSLQNYFISIAESNNNLFEVWNAIDEQIGKNFQSELELPLIELRKIFIDKSVIIEKNRIDEEFKISIEKGWQEWILLISTSICNFRNIFQSKFCQFEFPFPDDKIDVIKKIKKSIDYIDQRYWAGAYEIIEYIVNQDFIPNKIKLELYVILGEIQQFHFYKPYKAKIFFKEAEKFSSNHYRVVYSWAKYLFENKEIKLSKDYYSNLLKLYPNKVGGYIGMGDIAEKENCDAGKWFKKALENAADDTDAYIELAKYYIRTQTSEIDGQIDEMKERILKISPESEYLFYLYIGVEYEKSNNYDKAIDQYGKALNINKNQHLAYDNLGNLFLNSNYKFDLSKARYYFEKAMDSMPDYVEAYLNMAYTFKLEEKWLSEIEWYDKCPAQIHEYKHRIHASKGEAFRKLKEFEKAEIELVNAFKFDKESIWAKAYMESLAKDCYQFNDDVDTAIKLYNIILDNIGESYKADYHNRIGNLKYYLNNFREAIEHYQIAIETSLENAVFHQNLSGAYREIKEYNKAIQEIEIAHEFDKDELLKQQKLALVFNAKGNDLFSLQEYSKAIEEYYKAVNLCPTEPVYYSNLAGAYENFTDSPTPIENLDTAIYYYQKASELNPQKDYLLSIETIKKKKECLNFYDKKSLERIPVVTPIAIEVAANLIPLVEDKNGSLTPHFQELISKLRYGLQYELGHEKIPGIRVRGNETDLPDGTYVIMINEIPLISGNVSLNKVLVNDTVDRLKLINIKGEEAVNPANGSECAWVPVEFTKDVEATGLTTWDAAGYMILHLASVIRKNFADFVTIQNVSNQIEGKANQYYQEIQVVYGGISRFTNLLKIFAEEDVAIKELETICKTYIELTKRNVPFYDIVEELRNHETIRPLINVNRWNIEHEIKHQNVYELDKEIIELINNGIISNGDATILALEPEPTQEILTSLRNEVNSLQPSGSNPVIMVENQRIRRPVRKLVELEFPHLWVLSKSEIMNEIKPIGTIAFH
jgi:tetratricopeptide (TPR) repeat protein